MSLVSSTNPFLISYHGITHRIDFRSNGASISAYVIDKRTSKCLTIFSDIAPYLSLSFLKQDPQQTLRWLLAQGYSVRLMPSNQLYFVPGLLGGGKVILHLSDTPKNTGDLAQALRKTDPKSNDYARLLVLATNVIEAFASHTVKTPALLSELTSLAQSNDQRFSREVLKVICSELTSASLLDIDLLTAIRDILQSTPAQHLDPDDLVNILKTLCAKHESFHAQKTTFSKLYHLLRVLSETLDVMGDVNVEKLSFDNLQDPLYKRLCELTKHEDWRIATHAAYAKESLLRIGHDKTKLVLFLNKALSFGLGMNSLRQAVSNIDLSELISAYESLKQALHSQKKPQNWYHEVRLLMILSECHQFEAFTKHIGKLDPKEIPSEEHPYLLSGIFLLLIDTITNHTDSAVRTSALELLVQLNNNTDWKLKKKNKKLNSKIQGGLKAQLELWSRDATIGKTAQEALEALSSKITSAASTVEKHLPIPPSTILFEEATARPKRVSELIQELQCYYTKNEEVEKLRATYINLRGSHCSSFDKPFLLEKEVMQFLSLSSDKTVLLIQGGSGAGKTTFGQYLAYNLWENREENGPICLFIPPSTTANTKRAVEQTLADHGFSDAQIRQLQINHRFIFIFDGYDEIEVGEKENLHHEHHLADWNAKVIISCRTQYLSGSYLSLFAPLRKDGPQANLFQELWITPFTDKDIDAYLQQYLKQETNPIWTDYFEYRKHIDQIQGLKELISVPFLLHVIADVLPQIILQHQAIDPDKKLKLLKVDLYDAFVTQWFNRAEVRLRQLGKLPKIGGDIKRSFLIYCKNLAAKMFAEGVTRVAYIPPDWKEKPGPWEDFFGNQDPMLLALQSAAPLQKVGDSYSFIHKSIFEYFIFREDFDQIVTKMPSTQKGKEITSSISLPKTFATTFLMREPAVVLFWADAVQKYPSLEQLLFDVIEASKQLATKAIAAANSITILNVARVSFSRRDFRGIRIPGANLQGAIFDGAHLDNANLINVVLKNAFLRECSFINAQMEGVWFGERAFLQHDDSVTCVAYSPDGKMIATASKDKTVRLWDSALGKELSVLKGHAGEVSSCAFSPDGKTLASASYDHTVRLWDTASRREIATLKGHTGCVVSCTFSPDGKILVSGSWDQTVCLWDVGSGEKLSTLEGHTSGVTSCTFSPDGKTLASASVDQTVRLWELFDVGVSGKEFSTLKGHTRAVTSCTFSPDGKTLASASDNNIVRLWNVASGKEISTPRGHTNAATSGTFSPNGKTFAFANYDNTVHLWNVGSEKELSTLKGHSSLVLSCTFSPDSKTLASASGDKTVRLWSTASGKELSVLRGHKDSVKSCTFSPDGKILASASGDKTVRLWSTASGKELSILRGHKDEVFSCTFSPNGKTLASASYDDTVHLWDVGSGKEISILKGHASTVFSCAFSPNGEILASASEDKTVRLWDTASGKELSTLEGHSNFVLSCTFSPDGKTLASASWDKTVRLWRLFKVVSGKKIAILKGHTNGVTSCSFSPDGKTLASTSLDHTVRLWDLGSGKELSILKGHTSYVLSCAFSPDGKTLASANEDQTVCLWDTVSGKELSLLKGHTKPVSSCTFSPDGKTLASASRDHTVRLWDTASRREISAFKGHTSGVSSCAFSPDGKSFASTCDDHTVRLWDTASRREISTLKGHTGKVFYCIFSPDGKILASVSTDNTVCLWDTVSGKEISILKGHTSGALSCTFSPDGKILASAGLDKTVRLWDTASGKELSTLKGHSDVVFSCTFSPDGKTLASPSGDHTVRLWDVASGKELSLLKGHTKPVSSCTFSPDGKILASAGWDKTVRLWDTASRREISTLKGHTGKVFYCIFSPDGKILASAGLDKTVRLWDTASGKELSTLKGHSDVVFSCTFSPDGKTLASPSLDHTVRLWDVASGKELSTLKGHTSHVTFCIFSPDGKTLASASEDQTARLWELFDAEETLNPRLVWGSSPLLFVEGASLKGANLSEANAQLLSQRGAKEVPTY